MTCQTLFMVVLNPELWKHFSILKNRFDSWVLYNLCVKYEVLDPVTSLISMLPQNNFQTVHFVGIVLYSCFQYITCYGSQGQIIAGQAFGDIHSHFILLCHYKILVGHTMSTNVVPKVFLIYFSLLYNDTCLGYKIQHTYFHCLSYILILWCRWCVSCFYIQ